MYFRCFKRRVPQLGKLRPDIVGLVTTCQLFIERLGQHHTCSRFIFHHQCKTERIIQEFDLYSQLTFGRRFRQVLFKNLVKVTIQRRLGLYIRHIQRKDTIRLYPVDTKPFQLTATIEEYQAIPIIQLLHSGDGKRIAFQFLDGSDRFT